MSTVIVLNGQPGVGKTTLLKRLSKDLGIGYIAKDSIKELLGDTLHINDETTDAYYYGDASISALYAIVKSFAPSDKVMFIENAFWYELSKPRLEELSRQLGIHILQVYVTCDYEEAARRFNHRRESGERHSIHSNTTYSQRDQATNEQKYRPLDIKGMKTYTMDTTRMTDEEYRALMQWLQAEIGGK